MIQLLCFSLFFTFADTCNYQAVVRADSDKEVYGQFTFFNKTKGEFFLLKKKDEIRNFTIVGTDCHKTPTSLKTYLSKENSKPIGETSAYFEGNGVVNYRVYPDRPPFVTHLDRMVCMMGQCRG